MLILRASAKSAITLRGGVMDLIKEVKKKLIKGRAKLILLLF